jgi:thiamine biosynthesis lipoprotein
MPPPASGPLLSTVGVPAGSASGAFELRAKRLRIAMGTWVAIEAAGMSERLVLAAIEAAYAALAEVERRLHPRREGSDITQINQAAPGTCVPIHASSWQVLQLAQAVHALSAGTFDPCLPCCPGRLGDLVLSPAGEDDSHWALCRAPLALDLGGIGKGYAVDCAIEVLRFAGCTSGLVNAGGDLRVYARCERILLRHADGGCAPLLLRDAALAVSDLDAGHRPSEHQGYYRRSGTSVPACRYAAVVAPQAAVADALTKCVLLDGSRCAANALHALDARRVG